MQALSTLAALLDRTINEVKVLDGDFQKRLTQAVHETEASLQRRADEQLSRALEETARKIRAQVSEEMNEVVAGVRKELKAEREKLNHELDRTTATATQWEAEKRQLQAECAQSRKVLVEAKITQEMAEKAAANAIAKAAAGGVKSEPVRKEIQRVEELVKSVSAVIDDPSTELSTVIRKNVERAELESYLRGMRFAIDGK